MDDPFEDYNLILLLKQLKAEKNQNQTEASPCKDDTTSGVPKESRRETSHWVEEKGMPANLASRNEVVLSRVFNVKENAPPEKTFFIEGKCNFDKIRGTNAVDEKTQQPIEPIEPTEPEEIKTNGITIPARAFIALFVGKPRSGKSFLIKKILKEGFLANYFKYSLVFSESAEINHEYDWLPQRSIRHYSEQELLKLTTFLRKREQELHKKGKSLPPACIIIDDSLGRVNYQSPNLMNLIACHRHYNLSFFISTQELKANGFGSSTLLRNSTKLAFLFGTNQTSSIKGIHTSFCSCRYPKYNDFVPIFASYVQQPHTAFVYNELEDGKLVYGSFQCVNDEEKVEIRGF